MDDFDLLKLIKKRKELDDTSPFKKDIEKQIKDQGIRSLLIESNDGPLPKHIYLSSVAVIRPLMTFAHFLGTSSAKKFNVGQQPCHLCLLCMKKDS